MTAVAELNYWAELLEQQHRSRYSVHVDERTHIYTVRHPECPDGERFDSVTQILNLERMLPNYSGVDPQVMIDARWRGTNVHAACEMLDTPGGLDWDSLDETELGYVQGWENFRRDTSFDPIPEFIETPLANLQYRFTGRPDRIGYLRDGSLAVVDLKTGDIEPYAALQMAGYGFLVDPSQVFQRFAVRLKPNGKAKVVSFPVEEYSTDVGIFLSAVTCVAWRKEFLKGRR